tara:strand:- start:4819 stop:4941 length:123 start_codon:yes stop_codon:yes gene_type:complete
MITHPERYWKKPDVDSMTNAIKETFGGYWKKVNYKAKEKK